MNPPHRVQTGHFDWEVVPGFRDDVAALRAAEVTLGTDLFAYMTEIKTHGVSRATDVTMPLDLGRMWGVGELRLKLAASSLYRLYFSEPRAEPGVVVALVLGLKGPDEFGDYNTGQNKDIVRATRRLLLRDAQRRP